MWTGFRRHKQHWAAFVDKLNADARPETFAEAWAICGNRVCGMYEREAAAVWKILRGQKIESVCEIGRCLGGGFFLLLCACPDVHYARSIDLVGYPEIDGPLWSWAEHQGIQCSIEVSDSALVKADRVYDFVWIDGGHTAEAVKADIEIWRQHARLIGFHDYADKGRNRHIRAYRDVTAAIAEAAARNDWRQIGARGCSDIVFATRRA